MSPTSDKNTPPTQGEFPFCYADPTNLLDTPAVIRWRNRSRYLTRGGFVQGAGFLYQYNRGMFGNHLTLAVPVILIALGIAWGYTPIRRYPFALLSIALSALLGLHALELIGGRQQRHRFGTNNTLPRTARAAMIFLALVGVGIATVPILLETLRDYLPQGTLGIQQLLAATATVASANTVLRFLDRGDRVNKVVVRTGVGLLSWTIVTAILIGLVDYLYFGIPPYGWFLLIPFAAAGVAIISFVFFVVGYLRYKLGPKLRRGPESKPNKPLWQIVLGSLFAVTGMFVVAVLTTLIWIDPFSLHSRFATQSVAEITRQLARVTRAIESEKTQLAKDLDSQTLNVLEKLNAQKKALDAEYSQRWHNEYQTTYLAGLLGRVQSLVSAGIRSGPNTDLYRTAAAAGQINEWGLLAPLRPRYHQSAVAYLRSCAAIDDLRASSKAIMREAILRHGVRSLAKTVEATGAREPLAVDQRKRELLRAILVGGLISKLQPESAKQAAGFDDEIFDAVFNKYRSGQGDAHLVTKILADGRDAGYLSERLLKPFVVPAEHADAYRGLIPVESSKQESDSQPGSPLNLADLCASELPDLLQDTRFLDDVWREALLAIYIRACDSQQNSEADAVVNALESHSHRAGNQSTVGDDGSIVPGAAFHRQKWAALLGKSFEDLAMIAAGFRRHARQDGASLPDGFSAESYFGDAFRHTVCQAIGVSDPGADSPAQSPSYAATPAAADSADEQKLAQTILLHRATRPSERSQDTAAKAQAILAQLYRPDVPTSYQVRDNLFENDLIMRRINEHPRKLSGSYLLPETRLALLANLLDPRATEHVARSVRAITAGRYGNLEQLGTMVEQVAARTMPVKSLVVGSMLLATLFFAMAFVDPNMTSIHRFYRQSLASSFLMCPRDESASPTTPRPEDADPLADETDVLLSDLADRKCGSSAPYPLINAAINVSARSQESLRERNAMLFLFSPLFVGESSGKATKPRFVSTKHFEAGHPRFTAASAMTISGAAAAPLMGRYTTWAYRLGMVLANVRLGVWIRNPAILGSGVPQFDFANVLEAERESLNKRREIARLTTCGASEHAFVGLAFSGGGIRSAAFNFGVSQGLYRAGLWMFVDYLSTVSGGGYVGTSISVFMRGVRPGQNVPDQQVNNPRADSTQAAISAVFPHCGLLGNEVFAIASTNHKWLNVSDGGHVENLGIYPLLQRKCRLIISGDGEADPRGELDGLSRLMMLAEIDLGVRIVFPNGDLEKIITGKKRSKEHFAVATIHYDDGTEGRLVYMRSSLTGDEDQFVKGYKARFPSYPHESTADQFFTEEQFEAYRRLGEHIAKEAMSRVFNLPIAGGECTYNDLFEAAERYPAPTA
jgi:hypothetical protein